MDKYLITLLFLICPSTFSQPDSLSVNDNISANDSVLTIISDTLSSVDSTITSGKIVTQDTLAPIQGEPLTDVSTIISRKEFLFTDNRYTGDLLRSFPLNFIKDQGFVGQPNETFIYGVGNSGISYLQDGVLLNNRFTNSLDLNHVQTEDIDSIEIVPSPRGFLYGPYNNPVTVNFITRDFVSSQPYTRIKYYEGYYGEAMIDGKFNARIFKRWNFGFELTNRKYDSTYTNSEFSIWQISSKLKYFLSNSVNISAYYGYVDSKVGLNDGVDVDSIATITNDINSILYEPLRAPVVSPYQKLETTQHNFVLRTLAKMFNDSQLDLSLYYRYGLDELRDIPDSININRDEKNRRYGAALNYYFSFDYSTLQVLGNYEKLNTDIHNNYSDYNSKLEHYSIAGLVSLHSLDKSIKLSFFYKTSRWISPYSVNYQGGGIDLKYELNNLLSFYAGYSIREEYWKEEAPSFETGIRCEYSGLLIDAKYFNNEYNDPLFWFGGPEIPIDYIPVIKGIGLNFNYKFGLFLLETNTSYYIKAKYEGTLENYIDETANIPDWQFIGGLFVNDMFFDDNLDLKAGLKFYYTGEIKSSERWWTGSTVVDPTSKLDFTLAAEIKKLAIFYFVWENIFDKQYYITPYYPMPETNLRFGLAWELFN